MERICLLAIAFFLLLFFVCILVITYCKDNALFGTPLFHAASIGLFVGAFTPILIAMLLSKIEK